MGVLADIFSHRIDHGNGSHSDVLIQPSKYSSVDQYAAFNPLAHPRGGPGNPGQFTKKVVPDMDMGGSEDDVGVVPQGGAPVEPIAPPQPKAEYATAQAEITGKLGNKVLALASRIPDYILDGKGRVEDPHLTLKYGITQDSPEAIAKALEGEAPFRVVLGKVTVFEATEDRPTDVLKIEVHSAALNRLHKKISENVEGQDPYRIYKPHITLAEVQPGTGNKWIGVDVLEGESVIIETITFVNREHKKFKIPLQGERGEYTLDTPQMYSKPTGQLSFFDSPVQSSPRVAQETKPPSLPPQESTPQPTPKAPSKWDVKPKQTSIFDQPKTGIESGQKSSIPQQPSVPQQTSAPQTIKEPKHETFESSGIDTTPTPGYFQDPSDTEYHPSFDDTGGLDDERPDSPSPAGTLGSRGLKTAREELTPKLTEEDTSLVPESVKQFLRPHQIEDSAMAIKAMTLHGGFLNASGTGSGKAQPLDEPILTPTGWKKMGDIQVGDKVISQDGSATEVTAIHPQGKIQVYKVRFNDGSWTKCCEDHLWHTQTWSERRNTARGIFQPGAVRRTGDILNSLKHKGGQLNHMIPVSKAVQFESRNVLIDPYSIGALIGDGTMHSGLVAITTIDQEILNEVSLALPEGHRVSQIGDRITYRITSQVKGDEFKINETKKALNHYGLYHKRSHEKFIPDDYKFNTADVRLSVLQGLMDTDGTVSKTGHNCVFTTTSRQLADDVVFLVQSLGGIARINLKKTSFMYKGVKKQGRLAFNVSVCMPPELNPFRLSRKRNRVIPKTKYSPKRYISSIEPAGVKECQCISVAHESRTYLTRSCIVTHNSYSQLAVAKYWADQGYKVAIVTPNEVINPNYNSGFYSGTFRKAGKMMGVTPVLNSGRGKLRPGEIHLATYHHFQDLEPQIDDKTILIYDESHLMKNSDRLRSQAGDRMSRKAKAVMYATATPADKPMHIAHLFRAKVFGNRPPKDTFEELGLQKYQEKGADGKMVDKWRIHPDIGPIEVYRRINGLFDKMTEEGLMVKRDLSYDGLHVDLQKVELPDEAHETLKAIEDDVTHGMGIHSLQGLEKGRLLMDLRRQQEPYKVDLVSDLVKDELHQDPNRQVIIFTQRVNPSAVKREGRTIHSSRGTPELIKQALAGHPGVMIGELHGGSSMSAALATSYFQEGTHNVLIATPHKGGMGIDLDDQKGNRPRTMIIMTADFGGDKNLQLIGRAWRDSTIAEPGKTKVLYLFANTDIDDWNQIITANKMKTLGAVVSGETRHLELPMPFDIGEEGVQDLVRQNKTERERHRDRVAAMMANERYKWRSLIAPPRQEVHERQSSIEGFEPESTGKTAKSNVGYTPKGKPKYKKTTPSLPGQKRLFTQDGQPERYKLSFEEIHPRCDKTKRFVRKHRSKKLAQISKNPATEAERAEYDDYCDFMKVGGNKAQSFKDWLSFHRATRLYEEEKNAEAASGRPDQEEREGEEERGAEEGAENDQEEDTGDRLEGGLADDKDDTLQMEKKNEEDPGQKGQEDSKGRENETSAQPKRQKGSPERHSLNTLRNFAKDLYVNYYRSGR